MQPISISLLQFGANWPIHPLSPHHLHSKLRPNQNILHFSTLGVLFASLIFHLVSEFSFTICPVLFYQSFQCQLCLYLYLSLYLFLYLAPAQSSSWMSLSMFPMSIENRRMRLYAWIGFPTWSQTKHMFENISKKISNQDFLHQDQ